MSWLFGGGTQNTTTTSEPPAAFKPILDTIGKDALKFYNNGAGSGIYTGSTVVPWSQQTMQGMQGIQGLANRNINGPNGLSSNLQDIIKNGGFNSYQQGSLNSMQNMLGNLGGNGLSNAQDNVLGRFQNTLGSLGGNGLTNSQDNILGKLQNTLGTLGQNGLTNTQDSALSNYRQLANSNYNLNANPGAQGVLNSEIRDTTNAVNLNAAAAGRYGSGVHEGVLAQKVGDLSNNFRYNDFNNWLGRHDAANQNMANLSEQGLGNIQNLGQGVSALGQQGLGNIQNMGQGINALGQQGISNNQNLNSTLFNAGQSGLANMTNAYQGQQMPYQDLFKIGSMNEDLTNRTMQDQQRIWDAKNNQPWSQLQRLTSVLSGGDPYKSTTTSAPGPNPFLQTLGGLGLANNLLGTGTGSLFNPSGLLGNPFSAGAAFGGAAL